MTDPHPASSRHPPPLWLLVLVTFSGTLAMHMFVPALGEAARDLRTSPAAIQGTISVYIVGLGIGQLIYGPVSDAIGRRPTLLFGLALFTLASICSALSPTVGILVGARFLQALGGCAGLLLGRTIVRDASGPEDMMSRLATMQLATMVGPGCAPVIGGVIAATLGWRWIFAFFVALGIAGLAATWWLLPETRVKAPGATRSLAREYVLLVRSPAFVGCVVGGACSTTSFYAFVTAAPFLLGERFGQPVTWIGVELFLVIIGAGLGNVISGRIASSTRLVRLMQWGNVIQVACAALLLAQIAAGVATAPSVVATMFAYCIGAGLVSPVAAGKAMGLQPSLAGSASGLYGFVQMGVGAACATGVAVGSDHGLASAVVMLAAGGVAALSFRAVRRHSPDAVVA